MKRSKRASRVKVTANGAGVVSRVLLGDVRREHVGVVRDEHEKSGKPGKLVCTVAWCSSWCRGDAHRVAPASLRVSRNGNASTWVPGTVGRAQLPRAGARCRDSELAE